MDDEEQEFLECDVCKLSFLAVEPYMQHVKGKNHRKKVRANSLKLIHNESPEGHDEDTDPTPDDVNNDGQVTCTICKKEFSGQLPYAQHLKSSTHYKQVKRLALSDKLAQDDAEDDIEYEMHPIVDPPFAVCEPCKKQFGGPESYHQHMKSNKHRQQMVKRKILQNPEVALQSSTGKKYEEHLIQTLREKLATHNTDSEEEENATYSCEECSKSFSGYIPLVQHFLSPVHEKTLKKNQMLKDLRDQDDVDDETSSDSEDSDQDEDDILSCNVCSVAFSGPKSMKDHLESKKHLKKLKFHKMKEKVNTRTTDASHNRSDKTQKTLDDEVEKSSPATFSNEAGSTAIDSASAEPKEDSVSAEPEEDSVSAATGQDSSPNPDSKNEEVQTEPKRSGKLKKAFQAGIKEL